MSTDLIGWRTTPQISHEAAEHALELACVADDDQLTALARHAVSPATPRLRAQVTAATAVALDADSDTDTSVIVNAATAVELVHLGAATHDDVIDDVMERHQQPTVFASAGSLQAILTGDFLMARASELAADHGTEVAGLLAETIGWICEGRARQLDQRGPARPAPVDRLDVLEVKTARLFATAATIGAMIVGASDRLDDVRSFGTHLGMAHAIWSDLDELTTSDEPSGSLGNELARQRWRLPVTMAGPEAMDAIASDPSTTSTVVDALVADGHVESCLDRAAQHVADAADAARRAGMDELAAVAESLTTDVENGLTRG